MNGFGWNRLFLEGSSVGGRVSRVGGSTGGRVGDGLGLQYTSLQYLQSKHSCKANNHAKQTFKQATQSQTFVHMLLCSLAR